MMIVIESPNAGVEMGGITGCMGGEANRCSFIHVTYTIHASFFVLLETLCYERHEIGAYSRYLAFTATPSHNHSWFTRPFRSCSRWFFLSLGSSLPAMPAVPAVPV